jgi:hypothetical protein
MTYKQAGAALGVAEQTVKNRISRLLLKFGANHAAHLISICIASDVVSVPDLYQELHVTVKCHRQGNARFEYYDLHKKRLEIMESVISRLNG